MKPFVELQQYKKCIILLMVGLMCSTLAFVIYAVDPVATITNYEMRMSPKSRIFELWKKPPIDVYIHVHVFNITNEESFLKGEENLRVKEVGPYVYQETLENGNITWNDNGTISYIPRRTVEFKPDLSVGDPKVDMVTVPNIPLLGISSSLHDAGFLVNYPLIQLANYLDSKPILHLSVHDYLWGYDDSLVNLAGTVVPSYINFKKFGLLDRMYDEGENLVNMNVKDNNDMVEEKGRYLSIEQINGNEGLAQWGYVEERGNETRPENSKCNRIRGSTEGTIFPPHMNTSAVFRIYRKAFCRPVPIVFRRETTTAGLPSYEYGLPENFADPPETNPDNACFCRNGECLKKGLMDLTPCYYNIPAAASLPHFMDADPSLADGIDGLHPDPEKHSSVIYLQPTMGVPMYVRSRLQTNLIMKETHYSSKIKRFNGLTVPLFWSGLEISKLSDDMMFLLNLGISTGPIIQVFTIVLLAACGIVTVCWSLTLTLMIVQQQQQEILDMERPDSADLRIPLGYGQYTAIHIMPTFKPITSKNDVLM